jgi:hypothetical protein
LLAADNSDRRRLGLAVSGHGAYRIIVCLEAERAVAEGREIALRF